MRSLFISYDGMTDTLGQSQVIPYLAGLAARGHSVQILSCEKREQFAKERGAIEKLLQGYGIAWHPVFYHKRPPILAKLWDLYNLGRKARAIYRESPFEIVHCRSYLAAWVGQRLKRRLGVRFIFDMRGFWADERIDGGLWRVDSLIYGPIYRYIKRKEREFLLEADSVICLTHAASRQITDWGMPEVQKKITVIPCCADLEHFSRRGVEGATREKLRAELKLGDAELVLVYLGSLGTWYGLKEMFEFFAAVCRRRPRAKFLFVTGEPAARVYAAAERCGVPPDRVAVVFSRRKDVPSYLSLADVGVFFMKLTRSRAGFSPTKLAELLGMGLPVVVNAGIGDTEAILGTSGVAEVISNFSASDYERAATNLDRLLAVSRDSIRDLAVRAFSLDDGIKRYAEVYDRMGPVHS